jgi:carbon-monoxide dehydrogenase large subunit
VLADGVAKVAGTDRTIPIAKLAREAYTQTHRFKGEIEPGITETGHYDPRVLFPTPVMSQSSTSTWKPAT